LDLQQYEKNVRKGRLNDLTIGLWDTPALQVRPGHDGHVCRRLCCRYVQNIPWC
jgi:hypothetical protein